MKDTSSRKPKRTIELDIEKFGHEVERQIRLELKPLEKRIAALELRLETIESTRAPESESGSADRAAV